MAAPLTGIEQATRVAQKGLQEKGVQEAKQGASKFDQVMANKAEASGAAHNVAHGVEAVQRVGATQQVSKAQKVQSLLRTEKPALGQPRPNLGRSLSHRAAIPDPVDPVASSEQTSRVVGMMTKMVSDMERGQSVMDRLIQGGVSGKEFSSSELIALQAGMYKYTQELELTGKVVEKATTGLKDTLKTQV